MLFFLDTISWAITPLTPITKIVVIIVITTTSNNIGFSVSNEIINPTPAGINIIGIISIRNFEVLLTWSIFMILNIKARSISTNPYTLPGTGRGINILSISPINDINNIIKNSWIFFIFSPFTTSVLYT